MYILIILGTWAARAGDVRLSQLQRVVSSASAALLSLRLKSVCHLPTKYEVNNSIDLSTEITVL